MQTFPSEFKPGLYRHFKGGFYRALFVVSHHETHEFLVVYVSLQNGSTYVREWDSWSEPVIPDVAIPEPVRVPRFAYIQP